MRAGVAPAFAGFVPTLEVLPFLSWAPDDCIRMRAFPGYGDVVRGLLTGEIDGGVLPWELVVTDLLLKPGQRGEWRVPAVLRACPMELVLGHPAIKKVYPSRRRKPKAGSVALVFGIEARNSFTRFQILAWQALKSLTHLAPPTFKVLPMSLMLKGLEAGVVDGLLAPTPWGMQSERDGAGKLDAGFDPGEFLQHLVFVCRRRTADRFHDLLARLPDELGGSGNLFQRPEAFRAAALKMEGIGIPKLDPDLLWEAALRYPSTPGEGEFVPDEHWIAAELELLAKRHALEAAPGLLTDLARSLAFPP